MSSNEQGSGCWLQKSNLKTDNTPFRDWTICYSKPLMKLKLVRGSPQRAHIMRLAELVVHSPASSPQQSLFSIDIPSHCLGSWLFLRPRTGKLTLQFWLWACPTCRTGSYRPMFSVSASVSPCEPCLLDSKGFVFLVSSVPSDSYSLSQWHSLHLLT